MPQSVLLPAIGGTASQGSGSLTPSSPRSASSAGQFNDYLSHAQQRPPRQKDATQQNAGSVSGNDKNSKPSGADNADKVDKKDKTDKDDKLSASKDKKDHTTDANSDVTPAGDSKPQDPSNDTVSGDKTVSTEIPEVNGDANVDADALPAASDDLWLQQIEVSRQALQSVSLSDGGATKIGAQSSTQGLTSLTAVAGLSGSGQDLSAEFQSGSALTATLTPLKGANQSASVHTLGMPELVAEGGEAEGENSLESALLAAKIGALSSDDATTQASQPAASAHDLLNSLRQTQSTQSAPLQRQVETPPPLPLRNPEQSAHALQEQVQFLLNRKLDSVEIRLDPPELGNLQIKLRLNQDQAQVGIVVQNSHARELVEQTLPRLREMLAQQGIQLGQTQVQQQNQQQQGNASGHGHDFRDSSGQGNSNGTRSAHDNADAEDVLSVQQTVTGSAHAVDYYA